MHLKTHCSSVCSSHHQGRRRLLSRGTALHAAIPLLIIPIARSLSLCFRGWLHQPCGGQRSRRTRDRRSNGRGSLGGLVSH